MASDATPAALSSARTQPSLRTWLPTLPASLAARPEIAPLAWALDRRAAGGARAVYLSVLGHNLVLGQALDEALCALARAEVPAQPLKGALFVETLYGGDAGARPMCDLDVLVPPAEFGRAYNIVRELGYEPVGLEAVRWHPRFTHHRIFRRADITLELHWKLCHELAVLADGEAFFAEAQVIDFRGRRLEVARPELQLYFTLLHAATHALGHNATWIIDAVLLARRTPALDWSWVLRHAKAHRAERLLHAAARRVNAHFPGTFPGAAAPQGLRDRLLERLLAREAPVPEGPNLRSLAIRGLLTDRRRDIGHLLWDKVLLRLLEARDGEPRAWAK